MSERGDEVRTLSGQGRVVQPEPFHEPGRKFSTTTSQDSASLQAAVRPRRSPGRGRRSACCGSATGSTRPPRRGTAVPPRACRRSRAFDLDHVAPGSPSTCSSRAAGDTREKSATRIPRGRAARGIGVVRHGLLGARSGPGGKRRRRRSPGLQRRHVICTPPGARRSNRTRRICHSFLGRTGGRRRGGTRRPESDTMCP